MASRTPSAVWDFNSALDLIRRLSLHGDIYELDTESQKLLGPKSHSVADLSRKQKLLKEQGNGLGDFSNLWKYLHDPTGAESGGSQHSKDSVPVTVGGPGEADAANLAKGVRWRDEFDGADLEDNAEPLPISAATLRNQKRAKRRQKAKERAKAMSEGNIATTTDDADSDEELESIRRSPDRRAIVANIIGRPLPEPAAEPISPPTSPSPPKSAQRSELRSIPISNPFLWSAPDVASPNKRITISPIDDYTNAIRKSKLIQKLSQDFAEERRYLSNSGLKEPAFSRLNKSDIGVHVFIDMSNISIGFHDCLKMHRNIPITTFVRRVPMNFHNFSLVLERGRPAARRALAGSDTTAAITEAASLGYEVNILERVHKVKALTPKQKKFNNRTARNGNGNTSASGPGETSGSETNPGYLSATPFTPSKWVEQGVDEILHLKILESVVDAKKPSTIVLATGDAAEAEYSAGFMKMVERALEKGWVVELVSFRLNTSSAYTRPQFRNRWGSMFRWIQLDDYVEFLIQDNSDGH